MAKNIYVGVNNVARKVKKVYVGVNGVARKVKKAYIGVGGVARPVMSSDPIEYYGTATSLRSSTTNMVSTRVGNYVLFGEGRNTAAVDAYDSSLTRTSAPDLSASRYGGAGANIGDYGIFAGGYNRMSNVDAYNTSLVRSTPTALPEGLSFPSGGSIGDYALIIGGNNSSGYITTVTTYNRSLVRGSTTDLSVAQGAACAISTGSHVLFSGLNKVVDSYNPSLTRTTLESVGEKIQQNKNSSGTSINGYAVFSCRDALARVFNDSLTLLGTTLSLNATNYASLESNNNYMACLGGDNSSGATLNTAQIFDSSLTEVMVCALPHTRSDCVSESIGAYMLFASGYLNGSTSSTVDALVCMET